jgi:deoxycytidylate deaminase
MSDLDYLREACRYATQHSHDPDTQNGSVLVTNRATIYAANCVPPGVARPEHRLARPFKYDFIEHAERAAIHKAAAVGAATAGATLYCPWFACTDCARAIISSGIREVVGLIALRNATPARWLLNVELAEKMLEEACVSQRLLADTVGVTMRFDGRDFSC